jgi:hypothetical protein
VALQRDVSVRTLISIPRERLELLDGGRSSRIGRDDSAEAPRGGAVSMIL